MSAAAVLRALADKATPGPWWYGGIAAGIRHLNRNCDWYWEGLPEGYELPARHEPDYHLIALAPALALWAADAAESMERLDANVCVILNETPDPHIQALLARLASLVGEERE